MRGLKFMEDLRLDLSRYRLQKAKDDLVVAKSNLEIKKFAQSINRSYYAMFHAARALLALDKLDSKKHSGIISFFNLHYIKTKYIEQHYLEMLNTAFRLRNSADYDDFYIASSDEAYTQYENAEKFINRMESYLIHYEKTTLSANGMHAHA